MPVLYECNCAGSTVIERKERERERERESASERDCIDLFLFSVCVV